VTGVKRFLVFTSALGGRQNVTSRKEGFFEEGVVKRNAETAVPLIGERKIQRWGLHVKKRENQLPSSPPTTFSLTEGEGCCSGISGLAVN